MVTWEATYPTARRVAETKTLDEMWETIKEFELEGCLKTLECVVGMPLFEFKLRNDEEVKVFKALYQTIKVQEPEGDSLFYDCPDVLYTIHEREIK
ncbi:hypothetical protein P9D55_00255 [Bacillus sonorensis]|uniref:hypothetical protein n=1 Tax=Bacillus sonorensis TaxID=119858 RepID=UPI002DBBCA93|nr:hypothetical protein [Bacillus sonorensis]MEC1501305.1 hypothetical protein [Bacillus sonorensis]MEC1534447.1 hypothetical protein [Bacillus sonorensis]